MNFVRTDLKRMQANPMVVRYCSRDGKGRLHGTQSREEDGEKRDEGERFHKDKVRGGSVSWQNSNGAFSLGPSQISGFNTDAIAALRTSGIVDLTISGLGALSTNQLLAIPTAQKQFMTSPEIRALNTAQLRSFTSDQVRALTSTPQQGWLFSSVILLPIPARQRGL